MNPTEVVSRRFGTTKLYASEIGFGAWAIGGAVMAGNTPIGWGETDDGCSVRALETAFDVGITFYDTADFYGLGHSEALIGRVFANRPDVVIASKVGHRLRDDGSIWADYSAGHIEAACEGSLRRLRRDAIDYYQLHTAKVAHLAEGDAVDMLERLREAGKIRYWGVSLNTYDPHPEAEYLIERGLGHGLQLVLNVINQRALDLLPRAAAAGYGVIARMPLQFGLLSGQMRREARFDATDHRSFRLKPDILARALDDLSPFFRRATALGVEPARLALSYILSYPEVSTVIPGIRTPEQALSNAASPVLLSAKDRAEFERWYEDGLSDLLDAMRRAESG